MTVEFRLGPGYVLDEPGMPVMKVALDDPIGTFWILTGGEWKRVSMPGSVPSEWAKLPGFDVEVKMANVAGPALAVYVRPLGGVLPSAATE